jgi:tetratricopeptide (TPR) repeat protein
MAMSLTPERWHRLEALFHEAASLPADEAAAVVAREGAADPELGRELAAMLAHDSSASERISQTIGAVADSLSPSPVPIEWDGRRVGPYRIVRELGRGGMGIVFEAVRADDAYRKTVALKIAPDRRDVPHLAERLQAERQILADLDHPNIGRLLDGGTSDGIPYFVMELVDGRPITAYAADKALDLRARLTLFRAVCAAVQFAHDHLVIHRDLKPANIVVGPDGRPKLLDFGIAKLLEPGAEPTATVAGASMWTPDYASPEQVRGRSITPRTDVYSLGLVLYELITDERGQRADTSTPLALDRSICEDEPVAASARLAASGRHALARRVRGDLDTILLTSLQKDPDRRYRSASALSDDIARFLEGRPILARPASAAYRARKFLSRHRVGVAVATLVLASIVAGVVGTVYQARRAERRFQQVRELANAFVFDVHDRIEQVPGTTEARKAIVETGLRYLEHLRENVAGDAGLARELASAYQRIGTVQGHPLATNLGDMQGAVRSYEQAGSLLAPLVASGDNEARLQLATVTHLLALVRRAQGDRKAALAGFATAHDMAAPLAPADRRALELLGAVDADHSRAAFELRDFQTATTAAGRAMEVARTLREQSPDEVRYEESLAAAHNAFGSSLLATGRLADAAENYRTSVGIRESLVSRYPDNTEYRRNLAVSYGNLGDVLGSRVGENLGDEAGAAQAFEKALALAEYARTRDPNDRRARFDLANARIRLGAVLADADPPQPAAALVYFDEADRLVSELLAQDASVAAYAFLDVVLQRRRGEMLPLAGRAPEAVRALERARESAARMLEGPNGPAARTQLVLATTRLAQLLAESGDTARAERLAAQASAELARQPITPTIQGARAHHQLGLAYKALGRQDRGQHAVAREQLDRSASLWGDVKVAAPLEPRRKRAIARLNADIAQLAR